jgi:integrase
MYLTNKLTDFIKKVINTYLCREYVFSNQNGTSFIEISYSWENTYKRAGIKGLRFHALRHTFCKRMAYFGINSFTIMQVVGHKDTKTAKRYTNPTEEHMLATKSRGSRQH